METSEDTVGRMAVTGKTDFKRKVRSSMRRLQNDPGNSNTPRKCSLTYSPINTSQSVICFLMCPRKMMSWADFYVSLCECACCGLKRIPIQPRIEQNKILSCYSRQQNAMTHIPRNLPHYNLQQGSKCSASFRWGVGFGYRLKSAPFLRDHIRHD